MRSRPAFQFRRRCAYALVRAQHVGNRQAVPRRAPAIAPWCRTERRHRRWPPLCCRLGLRFARRANKAAADRVIDVSMRLPSRQFQHEAHAVRVFGQATLLCQTRPLATVNGTPWMPSSAISSAGASGQLVYRPIGPCPAAFRPSGRGSPPCRWRGRRPSAPASHTDAASTPTASSSGPHSTRNGAPPPSAPPCGNSTGRCRS